MKEKRKKKNKKERKKSKVDGSYSKKVRDK